VWVAVTLVNRDPSTTPLTLANKQPIAAEQVKAPAQPIQAQPVVADKPKEDKPATAPIQPAALNNSAPLLHQAAESADHFVLDQYPAPIRISLVETAKGNGGYKAGPSEPSVISPPTSKGQNSGNLFSLLEKASDAKPGSGRAEAAAPVDEAPYAEPSEPEAAYQEPRDATEEETRREAIRNRFLEAIRAAADKRQADADN
jgi:hypothetical protein